MRIIKFVVNWLLILLMPLWGGLALLLIMAYETRRTWGGKYHQADLEQKVKGKRWLWE